MPAVNGRGRLLVGPSREPAGSGAIVIAPPGVLLRAGPEGSLFSREGWREARWGPDAVGRVLIDQAPPTAWIQTTLAEVVEVVTMRCPHLLGWVESLIRDQIGL